MTNVMPLRRDVLSKIGFVGERCGVGEISGTNSLVSGASPRPRSSASQRLEVNISSYCIKDRVVPCYVCGTFHLVYICVN
jgi:hypothetical protein